MSKGYKPAKNHPWKMAAREGAIRKKIRHQAWRSGGTAKVKNLLRGDSETEPPSAVWEKFSSLDRY